MQGTCKNYFFSANSSQGFQNLCATNIMDLKKVYLLTGDYEKGKCKMLSSVAAYLTDKGFDLECIHSCFEPADLEGIILRTQGIGIFSSAAISEEILPQLSWMKTIDINLALLTDLESHQESLQQWSNHSRKVYQKAYECFADAILVHDEWEKIYIEHMDFDKANVVAKDVVSMLFDQAPSQEGGVTRERFFGGATYLGAVDYVLSLTEHLDKRYFIKGRPGSGKSTMLKKILARAQELEYDVEVYHCGFDPKSLDMILVPKLGFSIFDSTFPHEYFPETDKDIVIDMYEELIQAGTDETYEKELLQIKDRYKTCVSTGTEYLKQGKIWTDKANTLYEQLYATKRLNQLRLELLQDLMMDFS